jgi:hypothetical protein
MQQHRTDGPLEALVRGRERFIEKAARARRTAPRKFPPVEGVRKPVPKRENRAPAPAPRTTARAELLAALSSRQVLRRHILLHEILGPPKALERSDGAAG